MFLWSNYSAKGTYEDKNYVNFFEVDNFQCWKFLAFQIGNLKILEHVHRKAMILQIRLNMTEKLNIFLTYR